MNYHFYLVYSLTYTDGRPMRFINIGFTNSSDNLNFDTVGTVMQQWLEKNPIPEGVTMVLTNVIKLGLGSAPQQGEAMTQIEEVTEGDTETDGNTETK